MISQVCSCVYNKSEATIDREMMSLKRLLFPFFLVLVSINLFLASWYVINGDILFSSDIARDFFLLEELDQKKFVLIGPRSSVGGLFHGPLWLYLTYPGYVLGNGNPVMMGWYWISLIAFFLVSCYYIGKSLFNKAAGMLFVLFMSVYMIYHANGLFNPHGALFLIPAFFYFFIRYIQTFQAKYLIIHLFIAGCMIQFQMAAGAPLTVLSIVYLCIVLFKNKKYRHFLSFFTLLLPLSTFFLFDLRHEFILTQNVFRHLGTSDNTKSFFDLALSRTHAIFTTTEFLRYGLPNGSLYVFVGFLIFLFFQIKQNIHRQIYLFFLYFYIGFFGISLVNRYDLLYFYTFPIFPLPFLIFSSFITSKYKVAFLVFFGIVYLTNLVGGFQRIDAFKTFSGINEESWKGLYTVAQNTYDNAPHTFGYFVYSPDVLGYGPRYAMRFTDRLSNKTAYAFEKQPVTYLVIAPPPRNNPFMKDEWWRKNQVGILSDPLTIQKFENGYKIESYNLTEEEIQIPYDPSINPGLHFR